MERKMFGHRLKKPAYVGRDPGLPYGQGQESEDQNTYKNVERKDFSDKGNPFGKSKDAPPGYEGKEHVKYRDPGHSPHNIRFPEDEPHMKSHVSSDEEHEAEDDYHMDLPNQTKYELESHLKRARMHMDSPNQENPKALRGNIVHNVPYGGEEDTTGEEMEGPNEMQSEMPKEHRKKMISAVIKRKMKKNQDSY